MERKNVKNMSELAAILGVSATTVSRVLNGKAEHFRISIKTQKRVLEAAKDYNYIPNKIARGLKMERTETLGLIIPDISNPFFADISKSIEMEARSEGYSLILCDSNENLQLEMELVNLLLGHKVEGIIVAPVGTNFDHLVGVHESGLPIVIVDRHCPDLKLPFVTSDNYHGAFEAVNYLISMGHSKIACVQGIVNSQPNIERVNGYIDAMKKNNLPIDYSLISGENFSIENGYKQTHILFSNDEPPTAIFALSNLISLGVIKALNEIGIDIPDGVSLVSYDEQPYSAYLGTPLTTIEQKKSELGQLAVSVIKRLIVNNQVQRKPINMRLKTNLIIRKSVKNLNEII